MAIKIYKPTSSGRRFATALDHSDITKSSPERSLISKKTSKGGRNNRGRITVHHQGGGHKQRYRMIDFKRDKDGVLAKVAAIEYDPNRSARIALLHYHDGEKRYILGAEGLTVGQNIISGNADLDIVVGNAMPIRAIPVGTMIHNVELKPGKGGQMARSAGVTAQLMAKEGRYALVRLPSGELRQVLQTCRATIGQIGNHEHNNTNWGKAGRSRWKGIRPAVRGVAMNPHDHPHGGGEGRTSGGRHPVTPWGKPTKGAKTRNNKKTNRFIIKRRKSQ